MEFSSIVDGNIEKIEYIKALLRYVMLKNAYNKNIDPREYFLNCWYKEGGITIDKKYYDEIN